MEEKKPEIIDVEFEVLEDPPRGPVIDATRIGPEPGVPETPAPPAPGAAGEVLGRIVGEFFNTRLGKAAVLGFGVYSIGKAIHDQADQQRKRRRKARKPKRRHRRL